MLICEVTINERTYVDSSFSPETKQQKPSKSLKFCIHFWKYVSTRVEYHFHFCKCDPTVVEYHFHFWKYDPTVVECHFHFCKYISTVVKHYFHFWKYDPTGVEYHFHFWKCNSTVVEPCFQFWKRKISKMEHFGGKVREELFFVREGKIKEALKPPYILSNHNKKPLFLLSNSLNIFNNKIIGK